MAPPLIQAYPNVKLLFLLAIMILNTLDRITPPPNLPLKGEGTKNPLSLEGRGSG